MTNTKKQTYTISAFDMLFFGSGRPFSMASETWATGIFPPAPSTIYGYLRSIYFELNREHLQKANTPEDPTRNLVIHNFQLANAEGPLYAIPNCFLIKEGKKLIKLKLEDTGNDIVSNYPFSKKLISPENGKLKGTSPQHYLTHKQLLHFLKAEQVTDYITIDEEFQKINHRIGISKDYTTGKAEERKLYRIALHELETVSKDFSKLKTLHFRITISGLTLPEKHKRRLGGEAKIGVLQNTPTNIQDDIAVIPIKNNIAVCYLATPAVFSKDPKDYFLLNEDKLICISNKPSTKISGWDIKTNKPKLARNVIPAGTLFFFKFNNTIDKEMFITKFHASHIGDPDYTKMGFGKIFIGNY